MGKLLVSISIAMVAVFITGCGLKTADYGISSDNVQKLREFSESKINVGKFTAQTPNENQVLCRLAETISTPQGESFEEYIKKAFISELVMAGIYDKNSQIEISGHLEKIYGSTMLGDAYWEVEVVISSSTGKSIKVRKKREYPSAFVAYTACNNMATSFSPTIKELIYEIINHKDFPSLLK